MEKKELLTTEPISKRFRSQFDLVNYAIQLAENVILTGRSNPDLQNLSQQILLDILNNKDVFAPIPERKEETVAVERLVVAETRTSGKSKGKASKHSKAEAKV